MMMMMVTTTIIIPLPQHQNKGGQVHQQTNSITKEKRRNYSLLSQLHHLPMITVKMMKMEPVKTTKPEVMTTRRMGMMKMMTTMTMMMRTRKS